MKNLLLLFFALPLINFSQCPPTGGVFTSQAQIDALSIDYPNCTEVEAFSISGDDITDLSGLYQINSCTSFSISNNLILENTMGLNPNIIIRFVEGTGTSFSIHNNAALLTINGLENFDSQSGFESSFTISDNPMLVSLEGLPTEFDALALMSITNNDALVNLNGLGNLNGFEFTVISDNDNLIDLTGLNELVAESITISDNDSLQSLNGTSYSWFDDYLIIENNQSLTDISGIFVGDWLSIDLIVRNNANLSMCSSENVCYFFNSNIEEFEMLRGVFENNAPGCNSVFEAECGCELNTNDEAGYTPYELNLGETTTANNGFATRSFQTPSCNDSPDRKDVWFGIYLDDDLMINIDVLQTGYFLQLWEGYWFDELTLVENACGDQIVDIQLNANTPYYIQVWNNDTTNSGCSWFDIIFEDSSLSIPESQLDAIKVYPNPVKDVLNIETTSTIEKVEIFSLFGQKLNSVNSTAIDMSTYSSGIYIIKVISDGNETVYKLIKD